jgi:membrane protease YdiL (CAAX protease family)
MTSIRQNSTPDSQLGLGRLLVLHLLPGALITVFYFLFVPVVEGLGYPPIMSLLVAVLAVLTPFELGYLLWLGKQKHGRYTLKDVVLYREALPWWQYVVWIPLLLAWSFVWFGLLRGVDLWLADNLFAWMPAYALPMGMNEQLVSHSQQVLLVTFLVALAMNGVLGPLVEELYFRGYLLPRMAHYGAWGATLLNVVLFSLYHFFSPWQNVTRIVAIFPMVYLVQRKRNIYLSIFTHTLLNTTGMLLTLGQILSG